MGGGYSHLLPQIELFDLSEYRTELMGIAAVWVVLCHAKQHCSFNSLISALLGLGNNCVDIFLFLGGMGMYFSLERVWKKQIGITSWYKKRITRVVVPYLLAAIPFYIWFTVYNGYSVGRFFYHASTLSFWGEHEGMWYVDLLIPLYLITPTIALAIDRYKNRLIPTVVLMVFFLALPIIPISTETANTVPGVVFSNIQSVSGRIAGYILGYYCGSLVKDKRKISYLALLALLIGFFAIFMYLPIKNLYSGWLLALFMMFFFCLTVRILKKTKISIALKWLGERSLELYLANCILVPLLYPFSWKIGSLDLSKGNYFYYAMVVILNFPLAEIIHLIDTRLKKVYSR